MKEPIVDALKIKFSHHIPALVSSFVYILAALVLKLGTYGFIRL